MSGQMLICPREKPAEKHLRIRIDYGDKKREFRFVDQRTFGWMAIDELVRVNRRKVPRSFLRIAPDIFDPEFDRDSVIARIKRSRSQIKKVLLDQGILSGIGNIYADEALWLSKIHPERRADRLSDDEIRTILRSVRYVMTRALARGGTSFDDMYINVNGESGYFEISLNAYGREDEPCRRCHRLIRRLLLQIARHTIARNVSQRSRQNRAQKPRGARAENNQGQRAHPLGSTCVSQEHDLEGLQVLRLPNDPAL